MGLNSLRDLIGRTLGGCRVDALLGTGGMGSVFRAKQLRLSRSVAVKVLNPSSSWRREPFGE